MNGPIIIGHMKRGVGEVQNTQHLDSSENLI